MFGFLKDRFRKELLDRLWEKYGTSLVYTEENGRIEGTFLADGRKARFFIVRQGASLICVFCQGEELTDPEPVF
ncbi:MAG: hypothetical protein IJM50_05865 [Lachnospiraceae bacterium]|nr:hypothetical protein [Lachnospiraceae bacterium]